jgi:bifunctional non-homologous end joining protein LigD
MFRREWPVFYAFDLLSLNGQDLRGLPLHERKEHLHEVMPRIETRLRYVDHIQGRGQDLFRLACEQDMESVVAKCE